MLQPQPWLLSFLDPCCPRPAPSQAGCVFSPCGGFHCLLQFDWPQSPPCLTTDLSDFSIYVLLLIMLPWTQYPRYPRCLRMLEMWSPPPPHPTVFSPVLLVLGYLSSLHFGHLAPEAHTLSAELGAPSLGFSLPSPGGGDPPHLTTTVPLRYSH